MAIDPNPVAFDTLNGWHDDDHLAAFHAFAASARRMVDIPYKTRALGVDAEALLAIAHAALAEPAPADINAARLFFEQHFIAKRLVPAPPRTSGFLTGYFEPQMEASRTRSDEFPVPMLRKPTELVEIDDTNRPANMPADFRFARKTDAGFEEFFDRGAIQSGALDGRGLELAWLRDKVDLFFIHVQGSAKLLLESGGTMRVTYAAKSGHPYTSLGKVMCERLNVAPSQMTSDILLDWMRAHPDELDALLAVNRSYIFFKEVEGLDGDLGPVGAAKVPLIAGRSMAVDRTLHTFGSPIWIESHSPLPGDDATTRRLMVAHDTGSAIVGPARGDFFVGSGAGAGFVAGRIQHDADMFVLVPGPVA